MKTYIATVHLMVEADSEAQASDVIAETLRDQPDSFPDWGYAVLREPIPSDILPLMQHAGPIEIEFPEGYDYEEGGFYDFIPASHRICAPADLRHQDRLDAGFESA